MLKIYDASDHTILHPLNVNKNNWYITHTWDGLDSLTFDIPPKHESYRKIAEEVRITDGQNRYIVKDIDECSTVSTVVCNLDMDDWKESFYPTFRTTDKYLSEVLNQIKPTGWKIINAGVSSSRKTIEASEGNPLENVTPYDLLGRISEVYEVVFQYDTLNRELTVVDPTLFQASGEYLMENLNLKSIKYTGSTKDFATRLYAQGKEGLTFADINGGKDYVEDLSYSNRVISVGWKDERYTVKDNLLKAAKKKLKTLAFPVRSYECSVLDLAKLHPEYTFLSFALFRVVTLVDKRRKTRVNHQIVEYKEYPDAPEKNVVTLSSAVPKIQNTIQQIRVDMVEQDNTVRSDMQNAIADATYILTGAKGGNVKLTIKNGKPTEILIMDTDNVNTCKRVWRWNIAGFGYSSNGINGPYTTAITMDGRIVADFITAGTMSANLIKTGRIQSRTGEVYFDLDANNGKGELAASLLKGVEDGSTATARIGLGHYFGGEAYEGLAIETSSGVGGGLTIAIQRETDDYTLANPVDMHSSGNLTIRSQAIATNPGGNNVIDMRGNSDTGEGEVTIQRGTSEGSEYVFIADSNSTNLYNKNKIEFSTGGYARASIENNGAYFSNLFSNGIQVTSDRAKKSSITKLDKPALDQVKETPVYQYKLTEDDTANKHIGIMYDEAPNEIRRVDNSGNKTVDLYGMVSLLWQAVQELNDKIDALQGRTEN